MYLALSFVEEEWDKSIINIIQPKAHKVNNFV